MSLKNFCAAPWVEGVLRVNGGFFTCCRNTTKLGNWQQEGLQKVWHSQSYQQFRQAIINGKFPDDQCRRCYHNGTSRTLLIELLTPLETYLRIVSEFFEAHAHSQEKMLLQECMEIKELFKLTAFTPEAQQKLQTYFTMLRNCAMAVTTVPSAVQHAFEKLNIIGDITQSFLSGELTPSHVAPFRQVHLISKCNAQCIQCPGRYTGEIFEGPELEEAYLPIAFSYADDIIDFFMNGSDFLFYKSWKSIAHILTQHGVKLGISTNGILLTPANIRYLIDHQIIHKLNISMDGATKATVEEIRIHVNFEILLHNMRFLFQYATERQYDFVLSISFVLLKRNYHEFPALLRLIHDLKKGYAYPRTISVFCQSLETYNIPAYMQFYQQEHHALVHRDALIKTFDEVFMLWQSFRDVMDVGVFYAQTIEEFVTHNYPFPPLVSHSQERSSGTKIHFGFQGNAQSYQQEGWSFPESGHTWTVGNTAALIIPLPQTQQSMAIRFTVQPLVIAGKLEQQGVNVFANDYLVGTLSIIDTGEYAVMIGGHYLNNAALTLRFELPNATSPKDLGISTDERMLALAFQTLQWSFS
jgi:radical SAM protein with 4Fe4S-binding SPASM domain